ncbi:MAG: hypothetical protein CMJ48_10715 [Planctomycetaceae bacterium]|nr:hypothetical protein [Planctomycetaceae bacterium]
MVEKPDLQSGTKVSLTGDRSTVRRGRVTSVGWALLLLFPLLLSTAHAQDAPPRQAAYVPFDELDAVFNRDRKGVMLPVAEYRQLLQSARENRQASEGVGAPVVMTSTEYRGRVADAQLLVDVDARFTQFEPGWQMLTLPSRGLAIESATLDGVAARLGRAADKTGTIRLFSRETGDHTLRMVLSVPLVPVGSDRVATFALIACPSAVLKMTVPAGKRLIVNQLSVERPAAIDATAEYELPIGGQAELVLQITDRKAERSTDAMLLAATGFGVRVAPGEVGWTGATTLQVVGREFDRLVFKVPRHLEITDVTSSGLELWELADDPDDSELTQVTLNYRQPFSGARKVEFQGLMTTAPGEPWTVPALIIEGADSHVGRVLVEYPSGVRLQTDVTEYSRRSASVPSSNRLPGQPLLARAVFDVWREDFVLSFITQTKTSELLVGQRTELDVNARDLTLRALINAESVSSPLFRLNVSLPAEWTVLAVSLNGAPVDWEAATAEAGLHELRINFPTPVPAGQQATLAITSRQTPEDWPVESQTQSITLPEIRVPDTSVTEGTYLIRSSVDFELIPQELSGLDPMPQGAVVDQSQHATQQRLAYSYQDSRISGRLQIRRKPAQVSSETASFMRLDRETLSAHLETMLTIEGGGTRTVQIALSESAGENLQFALLGRGAQIVEQVAGDVQDGLRTWTLQLDRWIKGTARFAVDVTLPRGELTEFSVPVLRVVSADREYGFVAVEAAGDQQMTINALDAQQRALPDVSFVDLPSVAYRPRERVVAAYRYVTPGWQITLSETRFDRQSVPTAVCHDATIESVLGPTGEIQSRATFRFTAVGVQSLQVRLSSGAIQNVEAARVWSATVDGDPVEVRATGETFLVPVPIGADPDEVHTLVLLYANNVPALDQAGRLTQQPPELAVINGEGVRQPFRILKQNWDLHYPATVRLVESDGAFEIDGELEQISLLGRFHQNFALASPTTLLQCALAAAIVVALVGIPVILYRRRGLSGIAVLAVSGLCLCVIVLLLLPAVQQSREAARSMSGFDNAGDAPAAFSFDAVGDFDGDGADFGAGDDAAGEEMDEFAETPTTEPSDESVQNSPAPGEGTAAKSEDAPSVPTTAEAPPPAQQAAPGPDDDADDAAVVVAESTVDLKPGTGKLAGGRLSLALNLQTSEQAREAVFAYHGTQSADAGIGIALAYESRAASVGRRLMALVGALTLFWLLRRRTAYTRLLLATCGLLLPPALVTVTPMGVHTWLDGLFLGSVLGVGLWLALPVITWCAPRWDRLRAATGSRLVGNSALLLLIVFTAGGTALAQKKNSPAANAPQAKPSAALPGPRLVVPYDPDKQPLQAPNVWVPYEDFVKLWNAAHPDKPLSPKQPAQALVTEASYSAKLDATDDGTDKSRVTVDARFTLYSFNETQVTLPLPLRAVAVSNARIDGKPAAIRPQAKTGRFEVVLEGTGVRSLELTFSVKVDGNAKAGRFTLPLSAAPSGLLSFELPNEDAAVRVTGAAQGFRRKTADGRTIAEVPVDRGGNLTLSWQPAQSGDAMAAIVHATSTTALSVEDAGIRISSQVEFKVPKGSISDVTMTLPDDVRLRKISGADVGGWEIAGEDEQRVLHVFLRRPVTDATTLLFELFREAEISEDFETTDFPAFGPRSVTRDTGIVGIFAGGQFSVRPGETTGVSQINATSFPGIQSVALPTKVPVLAYRHISGSFTLPFRVARRTPQSTGLADHEIRLGTRKQFVASYFDVTLTESPRGSLAIQLPSDLLLTSVSATDQKDWYVNDDELFGRMLTIEFQQPRTGSVQVALLGNRPRQPAAPSGQIEVPYPLDMERLKTSLAIHVDDVYEANVTEAEGWRSLDPNRLPARLRGAGVERIRFAFETANTEPSPVELALKRAQAEFSAQSASVVTVTDTFIAYTIALRWEIEKAAVDSLSFTGPEWLEGRLSLQGENIQQMHEERQPDGRIRWNVALRDPQRGPLFAMASATLPPSSSVVRGPVIEFDRAEPGQEAAPLARQRHHFVLINQSDGQMTLGDGASLEAVRAEDLQPIVLPPDVVAQAAEILRVRQAGFAPLWSIQHFTQQQGAPASVNIADLTSVIAADGTWRCQATYTIKNRSRQFLALRLPADSMVLSVFVKDRPARPVLTKRDGATLHLIALPKTSEADLSFQARVILAGRFGSGGLPRTARVKASELDLPAPHVVTRKEDAALGIPVAKTLWTVYLPESVDYQLIDESQRTNLAPVEEAVAGETYTKLIDAEVERFVNILDTSKSKRMKMQARDNLKQIGAALQNYDDGANVFGKSGGEAGRFESNEQQQVLNEKIVRRIEQVEADFAQKSAADASDPFGANRGEALLLKEQAQKRQVDDNFQSIIVGNSAQGIDVNAPALQIEEQNKTLIRRFDVPQSGEGKGVSKPTAQTATKADGQLSSRARLRDQSRNQLFVDNIQQQAPASRARPQSATGGQIGGGLGGGAGRRDGPPTGAATDARPARGGFAGVQTDISTIRDLEGEVSVEELNELGVLVLRGDKQDVEAVMGVVRELGEQGQSASEWTGAGGLSLEFEIPRVGRKATFSKVDGQPRLALAVRSRETRELGLGLIWTLVWIVAGVVVLRIARRVTDAAAFWKTIPPVLLVGGLLAFFLLPQPLAGIGFVIFCCGALVCGLRYAAAR